MEAAKQEAPQPTETSNVQVLRYKLPSNPRKAEMMENFIAQLGTQLLEMEAAFARNNAKELTRLIRWILKYAGAFGMKEMIDLTEGLQASLGGDSDKTSEKLAELAQVYSTIEVVRS
jgi:HPt (histidine-containing phosphotransfer) domain-containing protein